jgi:hypothetical protein
LGELVGTAHNTYANAGSTVVALRSLTCTNQMSRKCPSPGYPSFPGMTFWSPQEALHDFGFHHLNLSPVRRHDTCNRSNGQLTGTSPCPHSLGFVRSPPNRKHQPDQRFDITTNLLNELTSGATARAMHVRTHTRIHQRTARACRALLLLNNNTEKDPLCQKVAFMPKKRSFVPKYDMFPNLCVCVGACSSLIPAIYSTGLRNG